MILQKVDWFFGKIYNVNDCEGVFYLVGMFKFVLILYSEFFFNFNFVYMYINL